MPSIFLSYRREDAGGEALLLFEALAGHYGSSSVFMDIKAIKEVGHDFRDDIDKSIKSCGVLLTVIGKNWVDERDDAGNRRLDNPDDFVRLETASALKRKIPVVPVLVHGARMPRPDQLPEDLKELAYRNGAELTLTRWRSDVELLIKALDPYVKDRNQQLNVPPKPAPGWWTLRRAFGVFLLVIMVVWFAAALWPDKGTTRDNETTRDTPPPPRFDYFATVPQVDGLSLLDAESTIETAGLAVGKISREKMPGVPPGIVFNASRMPGAQVDRGTKINLKVSDSAAQSASAPMQPPSTPSVPNFAGTWTCFEGADTSVSNPCSSNHLILAQFGSTVHMGGRDIQINQNGVATHPEFYVQDGNTCHQVQSSDGAYRINTTSLWIEGTTLTYETVLDTIKPYCGDPVGKELIVFRYHR